MKNSIAFVILNLCLLLMPALAGAQASSPAPYVSEMRDACITEMGKDAQIRVACMSQYSDEYHDQDARQIATNNKHVFMAYAVIWAIITIFLVGMWLRQRKLSVQIAALEAELKQAMAE